MDANQLRAQSDPSSTLGANPVEKSTEKFIYRALDSSIDSMRLVELEPAQDTNSPVLCKLTHVTFGQKPKYHALSYTWGLQTTKQKIYINGAEFEVGMNLWNALKSLRNHKERPLLWIDAICINQTDLPEKNQQLRFMPHIYSRAQMVLVWLYTQGVDYSEYRNDQVVESKSVGGLPSVLCVESYWNRLWIVQEIMKAREINICFGNNVLPWDQFIDDIKHLQINDIQGPLTLDRQRKTKYSDVHTLRSLLEIHQDAACSEPRDKIYGLIGLAADGQAFQVDYSKSLLEVWRDTIVFAVDRRMVSSFEVVQFSRLVKRLLGGPSVASIAQAIQTGASQSESNPLTRTGQTTNGLIKVPVQFAGIITHLGPSPTEIISNLAAADQWTGTIQQSFRENVSSANQENDKFLQALEEWDENCSDLVSYFPTRVQGEHDVLIASHLARDLEESSSSTSQRLYQLDASPFRQRKWRMGIAPAQARTGDFICKVEGLDKMVLLRTDGGLSEVIGTAIDATYLFSQDDGKPAEYCGPSSRKKRKKNYRQHQQHQTNEEDKTFFSAERKFLDLAESSDLFKAVNPANGNIEFELVLDPTTAYIILT